MGTPRIYTDQALAAGTRVSLAGSAAGHLVRVLRRRTGDPVILFNGDGNDYPATIAGTDGQNVETDIVACDPVATEPTLAVHLGAALSRSQKLDLVLQKATELGVRSITPLLCERSVQRIEAARLEKRMRHWRQVVISACEQCGRATVPEVHRPASLAEWDVAESCTMRLFLDPGGPPLARGAHPPESLAMLFGPEGGFSDAERAVISERGFHPCGLGPRVLRTETAPLAGLAITQYLWGDLGGNGTA